MYTSYIGKKFLTLYNNENGTNYSAEEFFDEVFFKLFFTDEAHLMHVGNSPFFQKPKEEDVSKHGGRSLAQYANLRANIEEDIPNMSIYVGAQARDIFGTTSGQVTDMEFNVDKNEMYSSWIGAAFGIGVMGRYSLLIDDDNVLMDIFSGWKLYREFLIQTPNVKDKEIDYWNAHWLSNKVSSDFQNESPMDSLKIEMETSMGQTRIRKKRWSEVIFVLCKFIPQKRYITANIYQLDKTNTTFGFINISLHEIHEIFEFRDKVFIDESSTILEDHQIEQLETFYNFRSACQMGTIGLKSLEPAKLRDYMPKGSVLFAGGKDFKFKDEESFINYQLYKIWIMAVLNKTELLNLASEIASALVKLETKDERGKKVLATLSKDVRESKSLRFFIENLSVLIMELPEESETIKSCVENSLKMPTDNFPLFITLIRFEYNYQKYKNK
ncbi:MAG: hypothetical protein RBT05_08720 [Bacteroidales bacterium]|jgi:hypothetical protein|nr:hypothetical protein [Bacteroidales bacterium]